MLKAELQPIFQPYLLRIAELYEKGSVEHFDKLVKELTQEDFSILDGIYTKQFDVNANIDWTNEKQIKELIIRLYQKEIILNKKDK